MIASAAVLLRRAFLLSTLAAAACAFRAEERWNRGCWHACTWFHGIGSAPDSLRLYMQANRAMTDRIEEALLGRRRARVDFDTSIAVWWLSDSGRPEYLPTLMRFAGHSEGDVATMAAYGLARHASNKAVRARLLEVYSSAPREVRNNMAVLFATVNDSGARRLLAEISRLDLQPYVIERIEQALAASPQPAGKGRWPCLRSESVTCPE